MRSRFTVVAMFLLLVLVFIGPSTPRAEAVLNDAGLTDVGSLKPHDTILIQRESDFDVTNGVSSGNGTYHDPYIIENLAIASHDANGIHITGTDSHFIIRNCEITGKDWHEGIVFETVKNGIVENCQIEHNDDGIRIDVCTNITIKSSIFKYNDRSGVSVESSKTITIKLNNCSSNYENGISLRYCRDTVVELNNLIQNSGKGISIYECNNIKVRSNDLEDNHASALYCSDSWNILIFMNDFYMNNDEAMRFQSTTGSRIANNEVVKNSMYDGHAIEMHSYCRYNTIENNTIIENGEGGIWLTTCSYNTIINNFIEGNNDYGLGLSEHSHGNRIHHNSFYDNDGRDAQAYDDGENFWNDTNQEGNYWSDYPDRYPFAKTEDGIWSVAYEMDSDYSVKGKDNYPLVGDYKRTTSDPVPGLMIGAMVLMVVVFLIVLIVYVERSSRRKKEKEDEDVEELDYYNYE